MSDSAAPTPARFRWFPLVLGIGLAITIGATLGAVGFGLNGDFLQAQDKDKAKAKGKNDDDGPMPPKKLRAAPELEGGLAWLNTGKPLSLKDLRGKIVLLDFWTYCCINCIHIFPDIAKLEKKYANQLVVIGVHSAKFDTEKNSESIRKAMLRYELKHPVVNDADQKIWDAYECRSWPTLVLIDPEGNYLGETTGEGKYDILDEVIGKVADEHRKKKTLNETPMRFDTAKFRDKVESPLYFPGKVLADEKGKRLFIADSTNHRIVVTDMDGNKIAIAGTGAPGLTNGDFAKAQFDDPQGIAVKGDTLYVADRKNHVIRELDLKAKTVKTIAGTGEQDRTDREEGGPALKRGLNSPWDLLMDGERMFIAMAGHHQIWTYSFEKQTVDPFAGDGRENIKDGPHNIARFAQPSGLTTDGKNIYVADCEVSAIRKVPMNGMGRVTTLVGRGLFEFGDQDGPGRVDEPSERDKEAKLQHAIGVLHHEGKLYVADTYNSKIKTIDLKDGSVKTYLSNGKDPKAPTFNEPCGLSYANGKIYVADTNAHRIQVIDLKTNAVSTLPLKGVDAVPNKDEPAPKK